MTVKQHISNLDDVRKAVEELNRTGVIKDILAEVVAKNLDVFQQKMSVGVQDSVSDLMENFKVKVASEIFDIAQNWIVSTRREKLLFPPNCRFLYTMGRSTIVVIEEQPKTRVLNFDKELIDNQVNNRRHQSENVYLSLPYVVFVLHFQNESSDGSSEEEFLSLYSGWRTSPLTSLEDALSAPLLPNTHSNLAVCTGQNLDRNTNIVKMTEDVLDHYWSSTFNADLAHYWWDKNTISEDVATSTRWTELSRENPLFILNLNLPPHTKLNDLIQTCITSHEGGMVDVQTLKHKLFNVVDETSQKMFDQILKYLRKTRFDRYYPKDVLDNVERAIESIYNQMSGLAAEVDFELNKLREEADRRSREQTSYGWERRGVFWNE